MTNTLFYTARAADWARDDRVPLQVLEAPSEGDTPKTQRDSLVCCGLEEDKEITYSILDKPRESLAV